MLVLFLLDVQLCIECKEMIENSKMINKDCGVHGIDCLFGNTTLSSQVGDLHQTAFLNPVSKSRKKCDHHIVRELSPLFVTSTKKDKILPLLSSFSSHACCIIC